MQKTISLEPGKYYHLYTRGNNKETLFRHPDHYAYFLQLYRKYIVPYADTFAYCKSATEVGTSLEFKAQVPAQTFVRVNSVIKQNTE